MPAELARFARTPVLESHAPVELLRASYLTHRFAPHAHDTLAIGVIERGAIRTRVGRRTVVIPEGGWIIALNAGDVHTGEAAGPAGYRYRMLYVEESLFRAAADCEHPSPPPSTPARFFTSPAIYDPVLASRLLRAHGLLERGTDPALAESAFVEVMGELARRHGSMRCEPADGHAHAHVVRMLREFLEEEHARVVTLAELAALTRLSPFHVSRLFRAAVGLPPYAYLGLVRVRRAQALIRAGYPLSAITHATGFADQSHFTRQFKRVVGAPPGQYARDIARCMVRVSARSRQPHPSPSLPFGPSGHRSAHVRANARRELAPAGPTVRHYR